MINTILLKNIPPLWAFCFGARLLWRDVWLWHAHPDKEKGCTQIYCKGKAKKRKEKEINRKCICRNLCYTTDIGNGHGKRGEDLKLMWKDEWNVRISEIWYGFTDAVSLHEIEAWERELKETFTGRIVMIKDPSQIVSPNKRRPEVFLITDSGELYEAAYREGIPFLLYLHAGNKGASFKKAPYAVTSLKGVDLDYMDKIYRRLFGIPWTILTTRRCVIREIAEDDLSELYDIYKDPSITRYTEGLYQDREKEREYIKEYISQVYELCGFGIWAVVDKATGKLIGRAGLAWREGFETPELGYVISADYQRKGIATEVCGAILKFARKELQFPLIRVLFERENTASFKLCRKLGFKKDADVCVEGKEMCQYVYTG